MSSSSVYDKVFERMRVLNIFFITNLTRRSFLCVTSFQAKFGASGKFFMLKLSSGYKESHHYERASTRKSDDDRDNSISDFPQNHMPPRAISQEWRNVREESAYPYKKTRFFTHRLVGMSRFLSLSLSFLSSFSLRISYLAERSKWLVHVVADSENPGEKVTPGFRRISAPNKTR